MRYVYMFEAKGIQRYILDSGPLRDLVGASDLVARLASPGKDDLLNEVLEALGLSEAQVTFSRRAGGAFMAHADDRETLETLRALWRLAASIHCPGLEMSDVLLTDEQAEAVATRGDGDAGQVDMAGLSLAYASGSTLRFNTAAELPPRGHPFTAFSARTGRLVTRLQPFRESADEDGGDLIALDGVTEAQRVRAQALQGRMDGVAAKFLPATVARNAGHEPVDEASRPYAFPRNLDPREGDTFDNPLFPFRRRGAGDDVDRRVAVVHADLSGLAEAFRRVTSTATGPARVLYAAGRIEAVVIHSVEAASVRWLLRNALEIDRRTDERGKLLDSRSQAVLPARPIVLGGDDITVIIRADLALTFTRTLLEAIETLSKALVTDGILEKPLSACAGLAVVNAGHPFLIASALAEDLCRFAKRAAKKDRQAPYPSYLAFHNAQSTLRETYDDAADRELKTPSGIRLTANPYHLATAAADGPAVGDLNDLAWELNGTRGLGKLIEAARSLFAEDDVARSAETWARWRKVVAADNRAALDKVDAILTRALGVSGPADDWPGVVGMISDALDWIDFGLVERLKDDAAPASGRVAA